MSDYNLISEDNNSTKYCCACSQLLPLTAFNKCTSRKDGLQTQCRECKREYLKQYYQENLLEQRQKHNNYYDKNKIQIQEQSKQKYKKNREKVLQRNRLYRLQNREKEAARSRIRRGYYRLKAFQYKQKIKNDYYKLTEKEKGLIAYIYRRAQALQTCTGIQMHVDHIVPLSQGGLHHPTNLQILTAADNLAKGVQFGWQDRAWPLYDDANPTGASRSTTPVKVTNDDGKGDDDEGFVTNG